MKIASVILALIVCFASVSFSAQTVHVWDEILVQRLNPGAEASSEKPNIKVFDFCTLRKGGVATDTGLKFEGKILWFVRSVDDGIPTYCASKILTTISPNHIHVWRRKDKEMKKNRQRLEEIKKILKGTPYEWMAH